MEFLWAFYSVEVSRLSLLVRLACAFGYRLAMCNVLYGISRMEHKNSVGTKAYLDTFCPAPSHTAPPSPRLFANLCCHSHRQPPGDIILHTNFLLSSCRTNTILPAFPSLPLSATVSLPTYLPTTIVFEFDEEVVFVQSVGFS